MTHGNYEKKDTKGLTFMPVRFWTNKFPFLENFQHGHDKMHQTIYTHM